MKYAIAQGSVLDWARDYSGPKFHALLCDPPYHLTEITKRFGKPDSAPAQFGTDGAFSRASKGFMGKTWDGGRIAFEPETWAALAEHLHPGAYGMAFASTRGYHRMAVAIEDAGLIIHTMLAWSFGSGFPKATRIDTQIDRRAGVERAIVGERKHAPKFNARAQGYREKDNGFNSRDRESFTLTAPATDLAAAWEGHRYGGQALKPGFEPLVMFSKPFTKNRYSAIICQISLLLEVLGCIHLPAHDAAIFTSRLHHNLKAAVDNFARQSADVWVLLDRVGIAGDHSASSLARQTLRSFVAGPVPTPEELSQLVITIFQGTARDLSPKDTATSSEMAALLQSIAWSWSEYLDVLSSPLSMYTTATEERLITDLRIFRLLIEQSIHVATMPQQSMHGSLSYVQRVVLNLQNLLVSLPLLNSITAIENATDPLVDLETDPAESPQKVNPIILFQKPYQGQPVDSITRTGAGAINVEAGRIGLEEIGKHSYPGRSKFGVGGKDAYTGEATPEYMTSLGRWPANLLLSHNPDCNGQCTPGCAVQALGEQSGESESRQGMTGGESDMFSGLNTRQRDSGLGDSGTAARFFYNADHFLDRIDNPVRYVAKASTGEREAGLEDFTPTTVDDGRQKSIDNPYQRGETERRNTHATIKPIDLCRYLASLLLPPDLYAPRRLLIPFSGSGSEMIGAGLAGWDECQGVELEAEHIDIARARLAWWIDVFKEAAA